MWHLQKLKASCQVFTLLKIADRLCRLCLLLYLCLLCLLCLLLYLCVLSQVCRLPAAEHGDGLVRL
jgi:hypothetical protein